MHHSASLTDPTYDSPDLRILLCISRHTRVVSVRWQRRHARISPGPLFQPSTLPPAILLVSSEPSARTAT